MSTEEKNSSQRILLREFLKGVKRILARCKMNGDPLSRLPTSPNASVNPQDIALAHHIFGAADAQVNRTALSNTLRAPLVVALIVGLMLHPLSDQVLGKFFPQAIENKYASIAMKMAVAAVVFFVLNHWALARAK